MGHKWGNLLLNLRCLNPISMKIKKAWELNKVKELGMPSKKRRNWDTCPKYGRGSWPDPKLEKIVYQTVVFKKKIYF